MFGYWHHVGASWPTLFKPRYVSLSLSVLYSFMISWLLKCGW